MVDQTPFSGDTSAAVCPWCSAALPDPTAESCPSCGANLTGGAEESLPGLTAVDPGAIVRSKQAVRPRSRLLSWLSGEDGDEDFSPAQGQALALPDLEVRREMLRLELEAEVAALQAESDALLAEAVAEGRVIDVPADLPDEPAIDEATDADADAAPAVAAGADADVPTAIDEAETPDRA